MTAKQAPALLDAPTSRAPEPAMSAFVQKITPYLRAQIDRGTDAIRMQYISNGTIPNRGQRFPTADPLREDSEYSPVRGLVHKYRNRVLWKVSYRCAAHCRFCTRGRQIGSLDGDLTSEDIDDAIAYIQKHPFIDDVLLSGGDAFYTPDQTAKIVQRVAAIPSVRVIRFGTRLPVQSPRSFQSPKVQMLLDQIKELGGSRAIFIQIQINHPDELTQDAKSVFSALRATGATLLSQSVFIRNLNDDLDTLERLFRELYYVSVIPYYIYRCDYAAGLEQYVCDFAKERAIMTELVRRMSGIAVPTYVVDVPGRGKIPVPLDFWDRGATDRCRDYDGTLIPL